MSSSGRRRSLPSAIDRASSCASRGKKVPRSARGKRQGETTGTQHDSGYDDRPCVGGIPTTFVGTATLCRKPRRKSCHEIVASAPGSRRRAPPHPPPRCAVPLPPIPRPCGSNGAGQAPGAMGACLIGAALATARRKPRRCSRSCDHPSPGQSSLASSRAAGPIRCCLPGWVTTSASNLSGTGAVAGRRRNGAHCTGRFRLGGGDLSGDLESSVGPGGSRAGESHGQREGSVNAAFPAKVTRHFEGRPFREAAHRR
jgi:hypothetical protein